MVRFGAEMVFSSKDSTITDEDIDRIIAKGEEATAELDAKMKKFTEDAIKFKMDDSMFLNYEMFLCFGLIYFPYFRYCITHCLKPKIYTLFWFLNYEMFLILMLFLQLLNCTTLMTRR